MAIKRVHKENTSFDLKKTAADKLLLICAMPYHTTELTFQLVFWPFTLAKLYFIL